MKRTATAIWNGSGKEGSGNLTTQSKVLSNTSYDFKSRFADGTYTNPEELIAAAHAGCFAMKLSFVLGASGFTPDSLAATATVELDPAKGAVTSSHLVLKAKVPGIDAAKFKECAEEAKANCPISKLLNAEITLDASLI
jgi:osmotically inducible protein OsmC